MRAHQRRKREFHIRRTAAGLSVNYIRRLCIIKKKKQEERDRGKRWPSYVPRAAARKGHRARVSRRGSLYEIKKRKQREGVWQPLEISAE